MSHAGVNANGAAAAVRWRRSPERECQELFGAAMVVNGSSGSAGPCSGDGTAVPDGSEAWVGVPEEPSGTALTIGGSGAVIQTIQRCRQEVGTPVARVPGSKVCDPPQSVGPVTHPQRGCAIGVSGPGFRYRQHRALATWLGRTDIAQLLGNLAAHAPVKLAQLHEHKQPHTKIHDSVKL